MIRFAISRVLFMTTVFLPTKTIHAQEINFNDLQRAGGGLSISSTVSGLASEGSSYVSRFSEIDSGRVSSYRQSSSTSTSNSGSLYICSVTCTGSWWASGNNVSVKVNAKNEDQAKELAGKAADPLCRIQKNKAGVFGDTLLTSGSAKCSR
jgi:hypothetical protein